MSNPRQKRYQADDPRGWEIVFLATGKTLTGGFKSALEARKAIAGIAAQERTANGREAGEAVKARLAVRAA